MTESRNAAAETIRLVDDRPGQRDAPTVEPGLKIYGERNTGTNYLEQLAREHLRCRVYEGNLPRRMEQVTTVLSRSTNHHPWLQRPIEANRDFWFRRLHHRTLGWKHAEVPVRRSGTEAGPYPTGTRFVAMVKNPYSWLLSLHRRPYQGLRHSFWAPMPFDDFLRTPWPTISREHSRTAFATPMALWSTKVAAYDRLDAYGATSGLRYEDLLADPAGELRRLAADLDLAMTASRFRDVERSTKNDGRSSADYRAYYLGERWRDELTEEQIGFINEHLDRELVQRWGYVLL